MISQRIKDKQNINQVTNAQPLKSGNMLYKAIELLKQDKQNLLRENEHREKTHEQQKKRQKLQIDGYKRKIAQLTETNIIGSLVKKQPSSKIENDNLLKTRKLELQVQHYKSIIGQRDKTIQNLKNQTKDLNRKYRQLVEDKQKHLEISLIEKISLEQKNQLYQKQITSKKKIIQSLKKQLEKANKYEFQLNKKQRQLVKRGKDMNKYEEQYQTYFQQNEKQFQRKLEAMEKQNHFLRKQIKKIVKKIKGNCQCEGQAEQWKQKLYLVGKQLAKARVELGKLDMNKDQGSTLKKKMKEKKQVQYQSDSQSIGSLTLSQQSSDQQCLKATQKKR